ncbi:MAG: glycosyltransferase family 2 protein [Eubacteriaceae bacterium]
MKELLIIIPAYNEEFAIGKLLDSILENGYGEIADILVINDKSSDNTENIVSMYGKPVNMITHIFNMGYGATLKTGYVYATKNNYQYVIQMDADGQHGVNNIYNLYEKIKSKNAADIIIGSRFVKGSISFKISLLKKIAIVFFQFLIKVFTKNKITDPTSGLQALNRRTFSYYAKFMNFDPRYPDANMIIKMLLLGYKIEEIPSTMYERTMGESIHSGLKPILYMVLMMLSTLTIILQYKFLKAK